jgi:hypothetical protein
MTGLDPVIFIGWLLIGIAAIAIGFGQPMAGSSPAMAGVESRYVRRLVLPIRTWTGEVPAITNRPAMMNSFEALGQLPQTQFRASLIVLRPQAWRQVLEFQGNFRSD